MIVNKQLDVNDTGIFEFAGINLTTGVICYEKSIEAMTEQMYR